MILDLSLAQTPPTAKCSIGLFKKKLDIPVKYGTCLYRH